MIPARGWSRRRAVAAAGADAWDVNVLPLIGGAIVWAYAGILIFVLVRRLRAGR